MGMVRGRYGDPARAGLREHLKWRKILFRTQVIYLLAETTKFLYTFHINSVQNHTQSRNNIYGKESQSFKMA
jgi:hypothetical protein